MANRSVGVLGIGVMGLPIARHLCQAGESVGVFDIDTRRCALAEGFGAKAMPDARVLAASVSVLFVSLPDTPTVTRTLGGPDGLFGVMQPDSVVVDLSTITPMACRDLSREAAGTAVVYLDSPLSGAASGAEAGTLAAMVGGDRAGVQRVEPIMAAFCQVVSYMGPIGSGQATKLAHQITFMAALAAFCEGAEMARRWGVEVQDLLQALQHTIAPTRLIDYLAPALARWDAGEREGPLGVPYIDLPDVQALAAEVGIDAVMTRHLEQIFGAAITRGCAGRNDLFALGRAFLGSAGNR